MNWWSDLIWLLGVALSVLHLLGILAALHALLTVRTAQGSSAWVLSLLLLPELTLLPYLVFGRSRFEGYIAARRQENRQMQLAAQAQGWPLATPQTTVCAACRPWPNSPACTAAAAIRCAC